MGAVFQELGDVEPCADFGLHCSLRFVYLGAFHEVGDYASGAVMKKEMPCGADYFQVKGPWSGIDDVSIEALLKMIRTIIVLACIPFGVAVSVAQTSGPDDTSGLLTNPVFKKHCVKCHGKNAEGRRFGGPSLSSDEVAALTIEDVRNVITNGKGRMPRHRGKLRDEESNELARQIKALRGPVSSRELDRLP
jgi:cytochrome c553